MKLKRNLRQSRPFVKTLVQQTLNDTFSSFRHFHALKNSSQRSLNKIQAQSALKRMRDAVASRRLSPPYQDVLAYTYNDSFAKSVCHRRKERRQVLFAQSHKTGGKIHHKNLPHFTEESYYVRCK